MAQTLDVAGALLANPQSATAALGGTGLPPYMSPTGFGLSGAGAVPYGSYGTPVQGPVTAGIVANSPRAPMAVNAGVPVASLGPATVALTPQQLYTSSSTVSAPQQVYYYTGGAPASAYLTPSDPTFLAYSPIVGGGLGAGPYHAVTVSTNNDGPLYVIARGQENDPAQGIADSGQSPAHGVLSLSTSLGAPLRRLEPSPKIRGTRKFGRSDDSTLEGMRAGTSATIAGQGVPEKARTHLTEAKVLEKTTGSSPEPATFSEPGLASCQPVPGQKSPEDGSDTIPSTSKKEPGHPGNAGFPRHHAGVLREEPATYVASHTRMPGDRLSGANTLCHPD